MRFFYGGENDDFLAKLKLISLNGDMQKFGKFLISDYCVRILRENKLTIHIERRNIYCNNFNTNKSIYDFFLYNKILTKIFQKQSLVLAEILTNTFVNF